MADEIKPAAVEAPSTQDQANAPANPQGEEEELTAQQFLDESDRAMALKQWTQAADGYAQALELLQAEHAEDAPAIAPVLHKYGRCLLEHAIVNSGPFGAGGSKEASIPEPKRQQQPKASGSSSRVSGSMSASAAKPVDPRFHFSGDAEDEEEEDDDAEEQGGENEEEEEDDFSIAFSVLDFARVIYQKALCGPQASSESDESSSTTAVQADPNATLTTLDGKVWKVTRIKNELAQVFDNLGDVGLESENFQQATSDYESALSLLSPLLHPHSRRLADAYLRLGLALEYHPDPAKQSSTIQYIESATNTLKLRLEAIETRRKITSEQGEQESSKHASAILAKEEKIAAENQEENNSTPSSLLPDEKDDVAEMDSHKLNTEAKEIQEVINELQAKIQDIAANKGTASSSSAAAAAPTTAEATKAALQQAINDAFLGASTNSEASNPFSAASSTAPVNDLSSMVRKKKKRTDEDQEDSTNSKGKGKAVANGGHEQVETGSSAGSEAKKPRVE
ncbi:unnamed protein product [Sympodiomycopsis kandeliae]